MSISPFLMLQVPGLELAPRWEGLPGPTQGPATESKPQRAAPQAGKSTHKVR